MYDIFDNIKLIKPTNILSERVYTPGLFGTRLFHEQHLDVEFIMGTDQVDPCFWVQLCL